MIVLSTGDELIPPTEQPEFGQVRDSNAYTIFGAVREAGAIPVLAGIVKDDVDQLKETLLVHEIQADAFISTGGVSVGERDVVKAAFFRRGDLDFYKVAMQPGMPQGFGRIEGKPYWGLPGNPVSVFVSFEVFVRPALMKMLGRSQVRRPEVTATLTQDVSGPVGKLQFARVVGRAWADGWSATPTGGRGSNLISTVSRANGLAMIPVGTETAPAGLAGPRDALPLLGGLTVGSDQAGADGVTRIVEVGAKPETDREAVAESWLVTTAEAVAAPGRRHEEGHAARDGEGGRRDRREGDTAPLAALPSDPRHRRRDRARARCAGGPDPRAGDGASARPHRRGDGGADGRRGRGALACTTPRRRSIARRASRACGCSRSAAGRAATTAPSSGSRALCPRVALQSDRA